MKDALRLRFPDGATNHSLAAIVAGDYELKTEELVDNAVIFYDTFDWRLYNKSLVLCQIGDELVMRRLSTGADLERLTIGSPNGSPPSFVWEIVDGPFKRRIAPIVGARRLLPVGEACVQTRPYNVLNADGKTVARLVYTQVGAGPFDKHGTYPGAKVTPLRVPRGAAWAARLSWALPAPGQEIQRSGADRQPVSGDVRTDSSCGGQAAGRLLGQTRLPDQTWHARR